MNSSIEPIDENLILEVDASLAKLKSKNAILFSVIKWRYVYNESYKEITERLGKKSPKIAGNYLASAENQLEELLR